MSPYTKLPPQAFWKTGVAEQHPTTYENLYRKRFAIGPTDQIATAGSCFAQHISRHLMGSGYTVVDKEPGPAGLRAEEAKAHGYGLYSARYGNIYTTRQLLQLAREAFGEFEPQDAVWQKGEAYFDAMRPSVEPEGLRSPEEVRAHRQDHLRRVAAMLSQADVLIFTLGLTETWEHIGSGTVYPTAPETIAGVYDPKVVRFKDLSFAEVLDDFLAFRDLVKMRKPGMRFLLTVSPVPLTATASGQHVLPATIYSKSVLRAVAGELYAQCSDIDYFPSYEIVAGHPSRGFFYDNNLRTVTTTGVETVMKSFFSQHTPVAVSRTGRGARRKTLEQVQCEESLLEAFADD